MPKIKNEQSLRLRYRVPLIRKSSRTGAILFCVCGLVRESVAQQILAPLPSIPLTPPALLDLNGAPKTEENPTGVSIIPSEFQLFKWGPVDVHPHVDYQFTYGTGLESSPGSQQASIVQTFSPGVTFNLGTHWVLDYSPSLTYYSSSQFSDAVNQSVNLSGGGAYEDWKYTINQSYSESSEPLVETGTQTETDVYSTALTASYAFNSAISLDLSANQTINDSPGFQSYTEWSTMEYVNYQFVSQLTFGLGAGLTYDSVQGSSDLMSENVNARVQWAVDQKTSFSINGGLEDQQFLSGGLPSTLTPIFGATATYRAFKFTSLTLNANRTIQPAFLANLITTTTTVGVNLNQRLFGRLNLDVGVSYDESSYSSASSQLSTSRNDDYYSLNARLSWTFLKRATASVFYQYSVDDSTESEFGFTSNQVGFELGYRF